MSRQTIAKIPVSLLAASLILLLTTAPTIPQASALTPRQNIKIGLLFPVSGDLSLQGTDMLQGAQIAVQQANAILASGPYGINFTTSGLAVNSGTSPVTADSGFKSLVDTLGVQVVVGPSGDREVSGLLADANLRHVPVISPSATSASLALPGDYLFRPVTTVTQEGKALATLLYSKGVRHVAMITRNDPYGTNLRDVFKSVFLSFSGTEVADPSITTYDPTSVSAITSAVSTLDTQVGTLITNAGGNHALVAVVMIAYEDDGVTILGIARTQTSLPNIDWFGGDMSDGRAYLPSYEGGKGSSSTAQFAWHVNLSGTFPTPPSPGSAQSLLDSLFMYGAIVSKMGGGTIDLRGIGFFNVTSRVPNPFALYGYDAAWLAMLSVLKANSYNGSSIANAIPIVANTTIGATGIAMLGLSGDRVPQNYVYWKLKNQTNPIPGLCPGAPCYYFDDKTGPFYNSISDTIVSVNPSASEAGAAPWTSRLQSLAGQTTTLSTQAFAGRIFQIETNATILSVSKTDCPCHLDLYVSIHSNDIFNITLDRAFKPGKLTANDTIVPYTTAYNGTNYKVNFNISDPSDPVYHVQLILLPLFIPIPAYVSLVVVLILVPSRIYAVSRKRAG